MFVFRHPILGTGIAPAVVLVVYFSLIEDDYRGADVISRMSDIAIDGKLVERGRNGTTGEIGDIKRQLGTLAENYLVRGIGIAC